MQQKCLIHRQIKLVFERMNTTCKRVKRKQKWRRSTTVKRKRIKILKVAGKTLEDNKLYINTSFILFFKN